MAAYIMAYTVFIAYFLIVIAYSIIIDDWNDEDTIKKHFKILVRAFLWPLDVLFFLLRK